MMRPCLGLGPVSPQPAMSRASRGDAVGGGSSRAPTFSLTFGLPPVRWVFTQGIPASELQEPEHVETGGDKEKRP